MKRLRKIREPIQYVATELVNSLSPPRFNCCTRWSSNARIDYTNNYYPPPHIIIIMQLHMQLYCFVIIIIIIGDGARENYRKSAKNIFEIRADFASPIYILDFLQNSCG